MPSKKNDTHKKITKKPPLPKGKHYADSGELIAVIMDTIAEVRAGTMDPKTARTIYSGVAQANHRMAIAKAHNMMAFDCTGAARIYYPEETGH